MNFLVINSIKHNYQIYIECNNINKYTIRQNEIASNYKDNIVYLLKSLLKKNHINLNQLCFIGAVIGPGSYTSLRVGLSMANTLSLALDIPVIGANLFEILILEYKNRLKPIIEGNTLVVISNNKGGYFAQFYDKEFHNISEPLELNSDNIYKFITLYKPINVVTNESDIRKILLNFNNIQIYDLDLTLEGIINSVLHKYTSKNNIEYYHPLEALYIKPPKITLPKIRTH